MASMDFTMSFSDDSNDNWSKHLHDRIQNLSTRLDYDLCSPTLPSQTDLSYMPKFDVSPLALDNAHRQLLSHVSAKEREGAWYDIASCSPKLNSGPEVPTAVTPMLTRRQGYSFPVIPTPMKPSPSSSTHDVYSPSSMYLSPLSFILQSAQLVHRNSPVTLYNEHRLQSGSPSPSIVSPLSFRGYNDFIMQSPIPPPPAFSDVSNVLPQEPLDLTTKHQFQSKEEGNKQKLLVNEEINAELEHIENAETDTASKEVSADSETIISDLEQKVKKEKDMDIENAAVDTEEIHLELEHRVKKEADETDKNLSMNTENRPELEEIEEAEKDTFLENMSQNSSEISPEYIVKAENNTVSVSTNEDESENNVDDTAERAMRILSEIPSLSSLMSTNTSNSLESSDYRLFRFCRCKKTARSDKECNCYTFERVVQAAVNRGIRAMEPGAVAGNQTLSEDNSSASIKRMEDNSGLNVPAESQSVISSDNWTTSSESSELPSFSFLKPSRDAQNSGTTLAMKSDAEQNIKRMEDNKNSALNVPAESQSVISSDDWTTSSESSELPSLPSLKPNREAQNSGTILEMKDDAEQDIYEFTSDVDTGSLQPLAYICRQSAGSELPKPENSTICDDVQTNNLDKYTSKSQTFRQEEPMDMTLVLTDIDASIGGNDSQAYNGDISHTQLSKADLTEDSLCNENTPRTLKHVPSETWSVLNAVNSYSTSSLKMTLRKTQSCTIEPSQQTDEGNTAFLATASTSSENSNSCPSLSSQNVRVVEGNSLCEASTIVLQSPLYSNSHDIRSSCLSYPATPDLSTNSHAASFPSYLPTVIVKRKTDSTIARQKSSTPRSSKSKNTEKLLFTQATAKPDNESLRHKVLKKNFPKKDCQGSDSVFNLGFSMNDGIEEDCDSKHNKHAQSATSAQGEKESSIPHKKTAHFSRIHPAKRQKRSLIQSLKRQFFCANSNISQVSLQDTSMTVNCLGQLASKPKNSHGHVPAHSKPETKLEMPFCGKTTTTSTASVTCVTLNSLTPFLHIEPVRREEVQALPTPDNQTCKDTQTIHAQPLSSLSEKSQQQTAALKNCGTSTSTLMNNVSLAKRTSSAEASHVTKTLSSSEATSFPNSKASVVSLAPKPESASTTVFKIPLIPKLAKRKQQRETYSKSATGRHLMSQEMRKLHSDTYILPSATTMEMYSDAKDENFSECTSKTKSGTATDYKNPAVYLVRLDDNLLSSLGIASSNSTDSSTDDRNIAKIKEAGYMTAELLATFMNDRDLKKFQAKCPDENSKRMLMYFAERCEIKMTVSDMDAHLITLVKSKYSRAPTEKDVQQLVRGTRRH